MRHVYNKYDRTYFWQAFGMNWTTFCKLLILLKQIFFKFYKNRATKIRMWMPKNLNPISNSS